MDKQLIHQLLGAREAVKQKLRSLKEDIASAQQQMDIHYAPITTPLKEIIKKLDIKTTGDVSLKTYPTPEETYESASIPEEPYSAPKTSIVPHGILKKSRVSWFTPTTSSSPVPRLKIPEQTKLMESTPQPSFLEDEYIGEILPETPAKKEMGDDNGLEEESGDSLDLDRELARARSFLQTQQEKSIISNKSLNKTLLNDETVREALKNHDPLVRGYLAGFATDEAGDFDTKYGLYESGNTLMMGSAEVGFDGPNIIIGEFTYKGTRGLYELLFKKNPGKFTYNDVKNYKHILKYTNAHHVNYDVNKKIAASKGFKYTKIIKPILEGKPPNVWWTRNWKIGAGIKKKIIDSHRNVLPNVKIEYKYWDNVNELCDRLQLLIASKQAGHTGHDNEIISIIEELREARVIE